MGHNGKRPNIAFTVVQWYSGTMVQWYRQREEIVLAMIQEYTLISYYPYRHDDVSV